MDDDEKLVMKWVQACASVERQQYVMIQAVMSPSWRNYPDAYAKRLAVEVATMAKLLGVLRCQMEE